MQVAVDGDLQSVLEFMQSHISAHKLVGIAERLPEMAKLLWNKYPQEPVEPISLCPDQIKA
jgi:hypothetical protein